MLSDGAPMIPVSRMTGSSLSVLVSLFATLTLTSASNARRPGVMGDGSGERRSVVVGEAMLVLIIGEPGGKRSIGENSDGVAR